VASAALSAVMRNVLMKSNVGCLIKFLYSSYKTKGTEGALFQRQEYDAAELLADNDRAKRCGQNSLE
jgi:hypothetical protein